MFFSMEPDRFIPYAAIEAALANAVYHKGYEIREPIEGLKAYHVTNRRYRNRRIGKFLKELHLTEGRNTGFRKILHALERNGSPKPTPLTPFLAPITLI